MPIVATVHSRLDYDSTCLLAGLPAYLLHRYIYLPLQFFIGNGAFLYDHACF